MDVALKPLIGFKSHLNSAASTDKERCGNGLAVSQWENKALHGFLTIPITFTSNFGPAPKMLGFLLLKNGTMTADKLLFSVEKCFPNQASLAFSQTEASPKAQLRLNIGSTVGSVCAIRAVDKSVQINNEDKELTLESVFDLFPNSVRGGYPDSVQEAPPNVCWWSSPFILFLPYPWITGTKILTNVKIQQEVVKPQPCNLPVQPMILDTLAQQNQPSQPTSTDVVRKYFPDTWLWSLVSIGKSGQSSIEVIAPDTITQFNATAFCVGELGFGLSPQVSLTVFQPFFVDLALPYSIIQGETLVLKATVFNYLSQCLKVQITLLNSPEYSVEGCEVCTSSSCICANQAVTFSWNITANKIGTVTISVKAEAVDSNDLCGGKKPYVPPTGKLDILQRQLLVKPPGIKKEMTENMYLCVNDSVRSIEKPFSLKLPKLWVQKSESAYISVMGDILGTSLQNLDNLIQMPYGCGEQNMLTMAPIIYVLEYLQATKQLGAAQKQKAVDYLQSGYQRELSYKRDDGSYSAFGMSDNEGSTWLTAFVMKCFYQAKTYIYIDDAVLAQAVTWLDQQQDADGCFISRGMLFHTLMKGGVEDDLSLNAYITAAFLERGTPGDDDTLVRALSCLKNRMQNSSNPYTMALLAYTFALANDATNKQILLDKLFLLAVQSGGDLYWTYTLQASSDSASVELTAYILLALITAPTISANDILTASHIVSWLVKQQNPYGGFSSTQDTVVGIQAMAKYTRITFGSKGTLSVTVSKNKAILKQFKVDNSNRLLLQKANLPNIPGDYNLLVTGSGCVLIQIVLKYNVLPVPGPAAFSIDAKSLGCGQNSGAFFLYISVSYIGQRNVTNMVVIEVEMLSGFQLYEGADLKLLNSPLVKKVNIQKDIVIIYIEKVCDYLSSCEN
ncbi:alpha-2-macroglobulin-like protein 1 [Eleutherodactylus coqui]|uniref:alpha-2-macroglobulin-like protein 1 n=1 Tax=Eleutherodactylus coqui TaxID=57060 RepID=UPI0034638066